METTAPAVENGKITTEARTEEVNAIIRKYALFGTATGLIPVFGIDVAAATAVQTKMVQDLAKVYGYDISDQWTQTAISNGVTALGGRMLSGLISGLAKSFSPLKALVGGALSAAFAGFITAEIGKIYHAKMQAGVNPADITASDVVNHIIAQLREGKFNPTNIRSQFSYLTSNN